MYLCKDKRDVSSILSTLTYLPIGFVNLWHTMVSSHLDVRDVHTTPFETLKRKRPNGVFGLNTETETANDVCFRRFVMKIHDINAFYRLSFESYEWCFFFIKTKTLFFWTWVFKKSNMRSILGPNEWLSTCVRCVYVKNIYERL